MLKLGKRWVRTLVVLAAILVVAVAVVPSGGSVFGYGPDTSRGIWPIQFRSNGERIYFTGTSSSRLPITPTGGNMHMRMHGGGCASCHGADRLGGRLMPRFWITIPALTPSALFGVRDEPADEDGHGDHGSYDDAALRRAITKGTDPSGKQLDPGMPRWSMAAQDLADLIEFIRSPDRN